MKPCQKHSTHLAYHGRKRHAFVRKVTTAASSSDAAARGEYNLLGEYGNGGNKGAGRIEYLWLPTETGQAQLIGLYRNNRFYAIHADPLGTPRLITDDTGKPVWQWPYSAFGDNPPSGILKATANPKQAYTNQPQLLKATSPAIEVNLRYPGQYFDEEGDLSYNYFRSYQASQGRYSQPDPIGLAGGWNRFAYVEGNPLSKTDPLGLQSDTRPSRPNWPDFMQPTQPNRNCATAECAAGLLPAPSENRTQKEVDYGQCKLVCQISLAVPVAACNAALGGGLPGTAAGAVAKGGLCSWVCK